MIRTDSNLTAIVVPPVRSAAGLLSFRQSEAGCHMQSTMDMARCSARYSGSRDSPGRLGVLVSSPDDFTESGEKMGTGAGAPRAQFSGLRLELVASLSGRCGVDPPQYQRPGASTSFLDCVWEACPLGSMIQPTSTSFSPANPQTMARKLKSLKRDRMFGETTARIGQDPIRPTETGGKTVEAHLD